MYNTRTYMHMQVCTLIRAQDLRSRKHFYECKNYEYSNIKRIIFELNRYKTVYHIIHCV